MQRRITDISDHVFFNFPIDSQISFKPFIDFINEKKGQEKTIKGTFYQHIYNRFEEFYVYNKTISVNEAQEAEELLELIYSCLSSIFSTERNFAWGLTMPGIPALFYGTDHLYELLYNKNQSELNSFFFF